MSSVANRYASALLETAEEAGSLEAVERDVTALRTLVAQSREFADFLAHPLIPSDKQQETLDALFKTKLGEITLNFLKMLALRSRLADAPVILEAAFLRLREARGILPVGVVSAQALTAPQEEALRDKLAARTGKTILLESSVDESLIGGFLLKIGDVVEDYSLATKLETFKRNVINA